MQKLMAQDIQERLPAGLGMPLPQLAAMGADIGDAPLARGTWQGNDAVQDFQAGMLQCSAADGFSDSFWGEPVPSYPDIPSPHPLPMRPLRQPANPGHPTQAASEPEATPFLHDSQDQASAGQESGLYGSVGSGFLAALLVDLVPPSDGQSDVISAFHGPTSAPTGTDNASLLNSTYAVHEMGMPRPDGLAAAPYTSTAPVVLHPAGPTCLPRRCLAATGPAIRVNLFQPAARKGLGMHPLEAPSGLHVCSQGSADATGIPKITGPTITTGGDQCSAQLSRIVPVATPRTRGKHGQPADIPAAGGSLSPLKKRPKRNLAQVPSSSFQGKYVRTMG